VLASPCHLLPRRAAADAAAAAEGSVGRASGRIPARRRRGSQGPPSFLPAAAGCHDYR